MGLWPRMVALAIGLCIVGAPMLPLAESRVTPSIASAQEQVPGAGSYLRARQASDLRAEPSDSAILRDRILPGQRLMVIADPKIVDGQTWLLVRAQSREGYTRYTVDAFQALPWTATPTRPTSTPTPTLPTRLVNCWVRPATQPMINVYASRDPNGSTVVGVLYADEYALVVEQDSNPRSRLGVRTSDVSGFVDQRDVIVLSPGAITATATFTPNPNATATPTVTPRATSTPTGTSTKTPVPSRTPTATKTATSTPLPTATATPKGTRPSTATRTPTRTRTPKSTPTPPLEW